MSRANKRKIPWMFAAASIVSAALAGCAGETAIEDPLTAPGEEADDGKFEAWNSANNPAYVDNTYTYLISDIPVRGEAQRTPWPGDYWATAKDSINFRWNGNDPSPAEKVETAFNLPGFARSITHSTGIYGQQFLRSCAEDSECEDLNNGSKCAVPRVPETGDKPGRCVPTWWGICHGWAPAAIAEPQPTRSVTKNGVTFNVGDLEALASFAYQSGLPTKFLSERCNRNSPDLGRDNGGRVREGECRDMNPGSMFVVLGNMLGIRKIGVVEDRTFDDEVWNQPVRGYTITNAVDGRIPEITLAQAANRLGAGLSYTPLYSDVTLERGATRTGVYTATAAGEVSFRLTGTNDADLYVKKGSEATPEIADCRSAGSTANEECLVNVAVGDRLFYTVRGFSQTSVTTLQLGVPSPNAQYVYNTAAKRFFYVEMDVRYISESRTSLNANSPDENTQTDKYQFILEADEAGRVLGGEWVGASQVAHPDFMWWPSGRPTAVQSGLTYSMVKELLNGSSGTVTPPPPATTTLTTNFTVRRVQTPESSSFTIGVPPRARLELTMTGTGNANLYVKLGRRPTTLLFDRRSATATSAETITLTAPDAGGTYYVRPITSSSTNAVVTITARITPAP